MRFRIHLTAMILLVALTGAADALAEPMSEQQVTAATETWLQRVITESRVGADVDKLDPHETDGVVAAYIAHLAGGGYCLCGADDTLLPGMDSSWVTAPIPPLSFPSSFLQR